MNVDLASMNLHEWADVAVIAQALFAFVAAVVAWLTIKAASGENRKWKTLEACQQYEFNERVARASDALREAYHQWNQPSYKPPSTLMLHARTMLNYLDGIAIGVGQGLYIEHLAKDHLRKIVEGHVTHLLDSTTQHQLGLYRNDYRFLVAMNNQWVSDSLYYKNKHFLPYR